jgi:hypothetical protein
MFLLLKEHYFFMRLKNLKENAYNMQGCSQKFTKVGAYQQKNVLALVNSFFSPVSPSRHFSSKGGARAPNAPHPLATPLIIWWN